MFGQNKLSKKQIIWQAIIFAAIAFTAIETTFSFSFSIPIRMWHLFVDIIITLIFVTDFILQIKKRKPKKKSIALPQDKRSRVYFLIDFIACIPFDIISYFIGLGGGLKILRMLRFLRLLRLAKFFTLANYITILPSLVKIPFFIVLSFVAIHWIACGWTLIHPAYGPDLYTYYNKSLYWAVTTLTTIGYGDITPTTNIGRLYTMLIMILGVGVYGIVIGNVSKMIFIADRYKEQTREKMNDLSIFMKHYNIPMKLQNAIFGFYNHLFTKRLSDNDTKIISDLPQPLQTELFCYMNIKLISGLSLFKGLSHNCLKEVATALEQMYFSPGQRIIKIGDIGQEMYIIGHGVVDVIVKDKGVVNTLRDGQFFGEVALLEETVRNADIKAQAYCDLYKLKKEDFIKIIQQYPELLNNMKKMTRKRLSDHISKK